MDMFSDLDINSPVTSTVVTASDLTSTVENALQFDESPNDFNMAFFDVTPYRKEGYEESQPLVYETSTSADSVFSGLPPYPSSERVDSGVVSPPAVVSSGMSSQSSMSSLYRQPHSTYQRSMSTFSMIESKKKNAESSGQRGHKRSLSSDEQFPAADSNSSTPSKSFVACKVCGDKASGYHYGVTSCEGCKGFFRRSIQKQIDYKCLRDKQCLVIRLNRNRCQYCRFRKCLDVGMSKDSVRYGRVPKRSREKSEENQVTQSETEQSTQNYEYKQMMYDIILSVSEAHRANCAYTEEKTRGLVRKPALFSMTDYQHSTVDGQIGAGSLELQKIIMWQQFAALLTPSIQQIVEFAKRIPGFQELTQDDKLLCIKLGFFEVWLVHAARLINPLDGTITFSDGSFISKQQMEIMFDQEFVALLFNFVCWFNNLQMNDSEVALYSAVVLLTAERDGIYDQKSIQQRQQQLIEALKYQLTKDHPNEPHIFLTLVSKLSELRSLGEKHLEHLRWFRANWAHLKLSPLFAEVFDIPKAEVDLAQR